MAAFSVGKTVFQTELGFNMREQKYNATDSKVAALESDLALRYGVLLEQLEVMVNLEYLNQKYSDPLGSSQLSGLNTITIGGKYLIYDPEKGYEKKPNLYSWKANHQFNWRQFIPAIGLYGGMNINLGRNKFNRIGTPNETDINLKGIIITQNQFGRYSFLTNIIVNRFPSLRQSLDYVVTLTRGFNSRVSGFFEIQGFKSDFNSDNYLRCGAAYLVRQNIQVDASIGKNFKKDPATVFGGVGISWRFDQNYEDVFLRIPKESKGKDEKAKKDGKDGKDDKKIKNKKKKRLDVIETDNDK